MSKESKKFFKEIQQMATTQQYDEEVMSKLLDIIVVSKMLADQTSNKETAKTLINISIVGESLAKKLYSLKDK
jgi:galactitol-specific phosphotransferase system IIB component